MLHIAPGFQSEGFVDQITYPSKSLNAFTEADYAETFGFYQNLFKFYSYMKLTKMRTFVLNVIKGSPLVWYPLKSCDFEPGRTLGSTRRELTPDRAKLNEKICWDELFDSCFETLLDYNGQTIELDADGEKLINAMTSQLMYQATVGARALLATGMLYDIDAAGFDFGGVSNDVKEVFLKVYKTTKGFVSGYVEAAAQGITPWLNVQGVIAQQDISISNHAQGILHVYDSLRGEAPKELRNLINMGSITTSKGRKIRAAFQVSGTLFNWVVNSFNDQSEQVATNNPRIRREMVSNNGMGAPEFIYFIDNTPVIPAEEINTFDEYMAGDTYFAQIAATSNVQLGMSFDDLNGKDSVGMLVERSRRVEDYETVRYLSHTLMKSALSDPNLAVATVVRASV